MLHPAESKKSQTSRAAPLARKAKAAKKTRAAGSEGNPRATQRNERVADSARGQTKTQISIDLLSRATGASVEELQQATGWQANSVRGFLSATVKRKSGSPSSPIGRMTAYAGIALCVPRLERHEPER